MKKTYTVTYTEGKQRVSYQGTLAGLKKIFGIPSSGKAPVYVDGILLYQYTSPNNIRSFIHQLNQQFLYQSFNKDAIPEIYLTT